MAQEEPRICFGVDGELHERRGPWDLLRTSKQLARLCTGALEVAGRGAFVSPFAVGFASAPEKEGNEATPLVGQAGPHEAHELAARGVGEGPGGRCEARGDQGALLVIF